MGYMLHIIIAQRIFNVTLILLCFIFNELIKNKYVFLIFIAFAIKLKFLFITFADKTKNCFVLASFLFSFYLFFLFALFCFVFSLFVCFFFCWVFVNYYTRLCS